MLSSFTTTIFLLPIVLSISKTQFCLALALVSSSPCSSLLPTMILSLMFALLQAKRPSTIDSFHEITTNWQGKTIALFLDYNGTLSPIVDNLDEAYMSSEVSIMKRKVLACYLIFVDLSYP